MNFFYRCLLSTGMLACSLLSAAQTNPAAQSLNYSQDFNSLAYTSTTYPAGIQGWVDGTAAVSAYRLTAPTADQAMTASGTASSTAGGIYNFNGKIGFLSSGSVDPAICLALNTTGLNGITVTFDAMTMRNPYDGSANTRINEITLQYRVGTTGAFTSVGSTYQNNTTLQTGAVTTPQNSVTLSTLLPVACDNQSVVQLRWVVRDVSGSGSRPSFAFDNITATSCTTNTSTYYYRSRQTGSWNVYSTWEASPTGVSGWIMACSPPTSAAAAVTITSGQTVTINTNATAPNLTIDGTLIFDNTARAVAITDYVNISASGTFITQASGAASHAMNIGGNLTNNGVFDMSRGGTTLVCNVSFNKNGNQTISGSGATTRFNCIGLNMGTSNANVLEVLSSNFAAAAGFLHPIAALPNALANGTLKMSGSFTFTGTLFKSGSYYNIVSTGGVWINNPNVTINGTNDSYDVSGQLKISAGTFNAGTAAGNAIRLLNGSSMNVSGGTVNVAGRIQAYDAAGTTAQVTTYNQSGGTVTLSKAGVNTSTMPEFTLDLATDSLIFSGGTMIFHNQASTADDLLSRAVSVVTGGLVQMSDATTTSATTAGFYIESYSTLPSVTIYPCSTNMNVVLATNLKVNGDITIGPSTALNNRYSSTLSYNISLTGNWINNGTFLNNNLKGVTFFGTSPQNVTGSASTAFNNLTINNASGVTLQMPATMNGALILSNGLLYTSATNLLSMNASSSVAAVSNASFVSGPVAKTGSTDFTFPVGKDAEYRPIATTALSASETFTAEYIHATPDPTYDTGLKDPTLATISHCEYWMLNRAGSATANVTLTWDTYSCGVTSLPDLAVAGWNGALWKDYGNTATTGSPDPGTGGVVSVPGVNIFGPFTLASTQSSVNPLPVELLDFTASYTGAHKVSLQWHTASETNNDYFTVERSSDANAFEEVTRVKGAGNSTTPLSYTANDLSALEGISYYRLKQTDFDGHYKYSGVVTVQQKTDVFAIVNTQYSETQNSIQLQLSNDADRMVNIELYDLTGKKMCALSQQISGTSPEIIIPAGGLAHGIYLLRVVSGNEVLSRKVNL